GVLKKRLIKGVEENKQDIILEFIPCFFSIYQQSNFSVEEIKADLIGVYLASVSIVEKYKEEPFTENEKNEIISKFLKTASLTELLIDFEESLLFLANTLSEILGSEDIMYRLLCIIQAY